MKNNLPDPCPGCGVEHRTLRCPNGRALPDLTEQQRRLCLHNIAACKAYAALPPEEKWPACLKNAAKRWRNGLRQRSHTWQSNRPPEVADVHKLSRVS